MVSGFDARLDTGRQDKGVARQPYREKLAPFWKSGGVWFNAAVSKTVGGRKQSFPGFESQFFLHSGVLEWPNRAVC